MSASADPPPPRMLSALPRTGRFYWTGGRDGELRLLRMRSTGRWLHPFWDVDEDDPDVAVEAVSGRGSVFTFTVNEQAYAPGVPTPYVVAIVQLDEQEDLRIVSNIVGCEPEAVTIGARVRVLFEPQGELFVPVFELDL
jgi:uncharacterized OB-fold protein